jgi:hypothetical protein
MAVANETTTVLLMLCINSRHLGQTGTMVLWVIDPRILIFIQLVFFPISKTNCSRLKYFQQKKLVEGKYEDEKEHHYRWCVRKTTSSNALRMIVESGQVIQLSN